MKTLFKRADEELIRALCRDLKIFIQRLPKNLLKQLSRHYLKNIRIFIHKVSKVSTYFTQLKIVDVLSTILKALDDGGAQIIDMEGVALQNSKETIAGLIMNFHDIKDDDFVNVSWIEVFKISQMSFWFSEISFLIFITQISIF